MKNIIGKIKQYSIKLLLSSLWYFCWGKILGFIFYKKQYYYGKWFQGKYGGFMAPGWKWICKDVFERKYNPKVPWPCSSQIRVVNYDKIHFHPDDVNIFQGVGNYFQAWDGGEIYIGKGTWIAMNVGIITTNHSIYDPDKHDVPKDVVLGEKCWIGMNSIILPGVVLGNNTTVGAGSVVTKSFPEGNCVIAGSPAKIIKRISIQNDTRGGVFME